MHWARGWRRVRVAEKQGDGSCSAQCFCPHARGSGAGKNIHSLGRGGGDACLIAKYLPGLRSKGSTNHRQRGAKEERQGNLFLTVSKGKQLSGNFREAAHSLSISSLPSFIFSKLSWGSGGGVEWREELGDIGEHLSL